MEINRKDLLGVILNILLAGILGGMMVGIINYVSYISLQSIFSFVSIVAAFFIGTRIKKSYENYHILYSILGVIGFILSYYLSYLTLFAIILHFDFSNMGLLCYEAFYNGFSFLTDAWANGIFGPAFDLIVTVACSIIVFKTTLEE